MFKNIINCKPLWDGGEEKEARWRRKSMYQQACIVKTIDLIASGYTLKAF